RTRLDRSDHWRLLPHRAAPVDGRLRMLLDDLAHGVDPTHVRHDDVHRHEIRLQLAVLRHGLRAGLRLAHHVEPRLAQNVAQHGPHEDRVVTDQYRSLHDAPAGATVWSCLT